MNKATRIVAAINSQAKPFQLKASLFHSSPVLERRRRTNWDNVSSVRSSPRQQKFNQYSKRLRKQTLLRNVNEFAENLFKSWQSDKDEYDHPSSQQNSWFRPNFRDDGYKKGKGRNRRSQVNRSRFEFCEVDDDIEFETIFYSAFGGNRNFYWSFVDDEEPRFRNSSRYSNNYRTFGGKRFQYDEEYDSSSESEKSPRDIASERLALGLSASGPLNVEDVKNAYRACALKWHPDRHQGSSKVAAEEKFKVCSAAYQTLCDKLAVN